MEGYDYTSTHELAEGLGIKAQTNGGMAEAKQRCEGTMVLSCSFE
jgi:hypothetical protein